VTCPIEVLVLFDRPGWCYARRAVALLKYQPPDVRVRMEALAGASDEQVEDWIVTTDVVLLLDYVQTDRIAQALRRGAMAGRKPKLVVSFNADEKRRIDVWEGLIRNPGVDRVVCVNKARHETEIDTFLSPCHPLQGPVLAAKVHPRTFIGNGVDTDDFYPETPIAPRPERCLWIGSRRQSRIKGYDDVLEPLEALLGRAGFDSHFIQDRDWDTHKMRHFYNSGAYILCASLSEGTANTVLEGVACGCLAVTTPVGSVLEWGRDGENCVVVQDRTPEAFLAALEKARERRAALAEAGMAAVRKGWAWAVKAQEYYDLFRRLVER